MTTQNSRTRSYAKRVIAITMTALAILACLQVMFHTINRVMPPEETASHARLATTYARLPMSFEANQGQTDPRVKFLSRGNGYTLFLTGREAVLSLSRADAPINRQEQPDRQAMAVNLKLLGITSEAQATGVDELPGRNNYFIGNDPKQWHTEVPTFAKVKLAGVYPGIDMIYYGTQRELEYDFVVAPGASPRAITLGIDSTGNLRIDEQGDLIIETESGNICQHKPVVYQEQDGARQEIAGQYVLKAKTEVGFEVGAYDASRPLIIDPVLSYSTFLGGTGSDTGLAIAVDVLGNAYVTGGTGSLDFPTTPGALRTTRQGLSDVVITKMNPTGTALVYSTYLGGGKIPSISGRNETGRGIAVDKSGNVYVTGSTTSVDFPATPGAFQTTLAVGASNLAVTDAFVTKLSPDGSTLIYSTYLGGTGPRDDLATAITVDGSGNAYITGQTGSLDFPVTPKAFQTTLAGEKNPFQDVFVTKLNPTGTALLYSTYLGGGSNSSNSAGVDIANGIAVDASGNAYVTGRTGADDFPTTPGAFQTTSHILRDDALGGDAFVTKLSPDGSALIYSTYLGGTGSFTGFDDETGAAIAVDVAGNAYISGTTNSKDFPVTPSAFQTTLQGSADVFVTKLNPSGTALIFSTYLGGSGRSDINRSVSTAIAVDASGSACITGSTESTGFPTTPGAFQTSLRGLKDGFVSRLRPDGSALSFSTYLGGKGNNEAGLGIAVDASGNLYVVGVTNSVDFPITPGAFQTSFGGNEGDIFITKLSGFATLQPRR